MITDDPKRNGEMFLSLLPTRIGRLEVRAWLATSDRARELLRLSGAEEYSETLALVWTDDAAARAGIRALVVRPDVEYIQLVRCTEAAHRAA